tara:strand:+ start:440 stop:1150 length:711 start_codon:yes stop_codon:yes gene_type:complete
MAASCASDELGLLLGAMSCTQARPASSRGSSSSVALGDATAKDVAALERSSLVQACVLGSSENLSQLSDATTATTNLTRRISFCDEPMIFHVPSRTDLQEDGYAYDADPEPMRLDDVLADGPDEEAADWAAFQAELAARRARLEAQRRAAASANAAASWRNCGGPRFGVNGERRRFAVDDDMSDEYAPSEARTPQLPALVQPASPDRRLLHRLLTQVECAPAAAAARVRPLPHQQQ